MAFRSIITLLGAAGVVSAAACSKITGCHADNCLRAVRATQHPTHILQASADCSSLLDVTVTPSTVTITQFSTIQITDTTTVPTTLVETIHETLTSDIVDTVTVDQTTTVTASPTSSSAPQITMTIMPREGAVSDGLPTYATACSSLARFASACLCIGVTAKTTTAPIPSTTVVVTLTETNTAFVTQVVETASVTVEDTTIFQMTTATATSEVVVTASPSPTPVVGILQAYHNGDLIGYVSFNYVYGPYLAFLGSYEQTSAATLQPNGQLVYQSEWAQGEVGDDPQSLVFAGSSSNTPYTCAIGADSYLSCYLGSPTNEMVFAINSNNDILMGTPQGVQAAAGLLIFQVKLLAQ